MVLEQYGGMRARVSALVLLAVGGWPVSSAVAKCSPTDTRSTPFVSKAPPAGGLAAQLAVLRRPQTDADRATIEAFKHDSSLRILYAQSLRLLRTDEAGRSWYFYAAKTRV